MKGDVRIEYVELGAIIPARRNAKQHDLGAIHESIDRRGFVMPLLVDEKTGRLVAGHGRLEVLLQRKAQGKAAPDRIQVTDDGAWLVPVIRGVGFKSDLDAEGYLVADNQTTILGGWDDTGLLDILKDLKTNELLDGTGFDVADMDQLLQDIEGDKANPTEDDVPPVPKKATAKRGEVWLLGDHRLMCGDCTEKADMGKLMGEEKAVLMITDPPWGVDYGSVVSSRENQKRGGWQSMVGDALSDDDMQTLLDRSLGGAGATIALVWHPAGARRFLFWKALETNGWRVAQEIVWVKSALVFGRADYHWRHETCLYAKREGASKQEDRTQTTVWETAKSLDSKHPTQKPVELYTRAIGNHAGAKDIVFDGFAGSGTVIMACEQTGRRARAMEIEPLYVDVAVKRWEQMTGRKATRNGGKNCG